MHQTIAVQPRDVDLCCEWWSFSVYHWCEVRTKMWIMNLGKSGEIPKLNEAMAIDLGANMLGEGKICVWYCF